MMTTNAVICLSIYTAILIFSYPVVRRSWLRAYPVFLAGFVSNAIALFFFSLERGTSVLHALVVCLIWSVFLRAQASLWRLCSAITLPNLSPNGSPTLRLNLLLNLKRC